MDFRLSRTMIAPIVIALLLCAASAADAASKATLRSGAAIYRKQCAECHGPKGEGVADKHDEPLYGQRSLDSLARLIERTMPEDAPEKCVGADARAVAAYIYESFYSPQARARNNPVRIDLTRLTNRQLRESIADLVGSFRPVRQTFTTGGLRAEYYQSKGMNKKDKRILERQDPWVDYDYGEGSPLPEITPDQFSIAWAGSLVVPESGHYEFRLRTPNGARFYLNSDLLAGDSNRRDDSDARRQEALLDLWVSSGAEPREAAAQLYLLGGRSYPLRLDFFKFKEKTASIRLEWKPPHGQWSVIPASVLAPEPSSSVAIVDVAFPPDDASEGYERGTGISKEWQEATAKAAVQAAALVEAQVNSLADTSDKATNRIERLKEFCAAFAARAFRRPLKAELRQTLVDRQFEEAAAPEVAVKRLVMLVLTSPRFLYPGLEPAADDHAVAARLALALWDSIPDAPLLEAAARGELRTREQVRAQADRMVQDPRAKEKLREFFRHWLAVEEGDDISKDPAAFPGFDETFVADLRTSLERFVEHVVWSERSDYRELLLADYLFLNPRLAKFYGAPAAGDIAPDTFAPVRFSPGERAGILTHPFLLAAFSYHRSTSPIHRGVFLTRNVLGRFLKPPPMAIEFMDDRFDPSLTMREKVTELTSKRACMSCHTTINPLGFSLEYYDAAGRLRTTDNNKPVNAESDYTTAEGETIRLRGARDLAEHAATSPDARLGFVRQLFHHSIKQAPPAYGPDTLQRLDEGFVRSEYHILKLLSQIAVTAALHGVNPHTP